MMRSFYVIIFSLAFSAGDVESQSLTIGSVTVDLKEPADRTLNRLRQIYRLERFGDSDDVTSWYVMEGDREVGSLLVSTGGIVVQASRLWQTAGTSTLDDAISALSTVKGRCVVTPYNSTQPNVTTNSIKMLCDGRMFSLRKMIFKRNGSTSFAVEESVSADLTPPR